MHKLVIAIVCFALGGVAMLFATVTFYGPAPETKLVTTSVPLDMNDAQSVLARLKPLVYNSWDASIFVFGDGAIHVSVKTNGIEHQGKGMTLPLAIQNMLDGDPAIRAALTAP